MIEVVIVGLVLVALLIAVIGLFRGNKKGSGRTWDNFRLYDDRVIARIGRPAKMYLVERA